MLADSRGRRNAPDYGVFGAMATGQWHNPPSVRTERSELGRAEIYQLCEERVADKQHWAG